MKGDTSNFQNEWDFSTVPREQLAACFVHEYARELTRQWPKLLQLLGKATHYFELPKGHADRWKGFRIYQLVYRIFSRRFGHCPAFWLFPDTCWQNLNAKERLRLVAAVNFPAEYKRVSIHTLRELEPAKQRSIETFALVHEFLSDEELDGTEYGFFAVDWNYPDREIESAFKSWLRKQRNERAKLGLPKISTARTHVADFATSCAGREHYGS